MSPGGLHLPLSVVLSWPTPNYVNPVTQGPALKIINILSIVLGTCVVAARIYARFVLTKAPGADDAFIVVGLAFGIAFSALTIIATDDLGVGRHIWDVLPANGPAIRLNLFASQWCYNISLTFIKISILLLYKRLSGVFTKSFLWASWIGIAYNIVCATSFCVMLLFECRPVQAYWLSYDQAWAAEHNYLCSPIDRTALTVYGALSVVGDIYSTILPLILVSTLKLPLRRMFSLYSLFALGFVVAGAGIVRTWFIYVTTNKTYDTSWKMSIALFWTTFELNLALLCACAPAIKPLFKKYLIEPMRRYSSQTGRNESCQYRNEPYQYRNESRQHQNDTVGSKSIQDQAQFNFDFDFNNNDNDNDDNNNKNWISTEAIEFDELPQPSEKTILDIPSPSTSPRIDA